MGATPQKIKSKYIATNRVFSKQLELENLTENTVLIAIYDSNNNKQFESIMKDNLVFSTESFKPGLYTLIVYNSKDVSQEMERIPLICGDDLFKDSL